MPPERAMALACAAPLPSREPASPARALVGLHEVTLALGGKTLLAGVSLVIERGAPTLLMGPNGAGKTSLLKIADGLLAPTRGTVVRAGGLRTAFVFQRPVMLRRSVAANVAFARKAAGLATAGAEIVRCLDRVGLAAFRDRPARTLSGGEQQRLAIARALAQEPQILFLDEPTANLDPAATQTVESVVAAVAADGVKVVMSTHDIGQARRVAGDVVLLVGGRIAEHASARSFFTEPATNAARRFLAGDLVL